MKKRTIIYVFGPKRLEQSYRDNIPFPNDYSGWLKIGLTTSENDTIDKWDVAIKRIKQESRTGLNETCVLFDVFEYPYLSGKADDDIRWKMTSGIVYNLPNSKANNKLIKNRYEIKAGQEFVYGASRNQILAAIAIFERELISKFRNTDTFYYLMDLLDRNTMDISDEQEDKQPERQQPLIDSFYEKLKSSLPENIKQKSNHSKGKNYLTIQSGHKGCKWYFLTFNAKRGTTRVALETYDGGESVKDEVNQFILDNDIRTVIPLLREARQGVKNKNKFSWDIYGKYEGNEDSVINWFVENLKTMFYLFEPKS